MKPTSLGVRILTVSLLVGGVDCQHQPSPRATILRTQPMAGELTPAALREGVRVTFDRPVAPPEWIGKTVAGPTLVLDPPVTGEASWLDSQTLAFFPGGNLQPSTAYRVTLAPGLKMAPGVSLDRWEGLTFVHDRLRMDHFSLNSVAGLAPPQPTLLLTLSQPVLPRDVAAACAFVERRPGGKDGPTTPVQMAPPPDRPTAAIQLISDQPLRPSTAYVFRCASSLRAAAGTVGLAAAFEHPFTTHGPAGVKSVAPDGHDIAADGVTVRITFATPMKTDDVRGHVTLQGDGLAAQPLEPSWDSAGTTLSWSGDLQVETRYQVQISAGLKDVFGQEITTDTTHVFTVGDESPRLRVQRGIYVVEKASGRYPVYTRNLPSFDVRCARVPEARLAAVLTGPANYDAWWNNDDGSPIDYDGLGLRPRTRTIQPATARNRWHDNSLDLPALCGDGRAGGVYVLELHSDDDATSLESRQRERRSLASVTDLGLLAKVGNGSSLVWVVRLSTGEPVAEATVKIRDLGGNVQFTGRSGADGVVLGPGATKVLGVPPKNVGPGAGVGVGEGEGEGDWADLRARRVLVTAQLGDDLAVLDTNWNNGVQVWNFAVDEDRRGGQHRVRGFLHSDRGLYRPGDTAHLHGLARVIDVAGAMKVPRKRQLHVSLIDPRGSTLVDKELPLSAFGGFALDFPIPAEARLGDYTVRGQLEGQIFSDAFSVEEYRPRTFEVKVRAGKDNDLLRRPLTFELAASYLYGAPLSAGKLTWNVRRRLHVVQFPGYDDYAFQDLATILDGGWWWARQGERSFSEAVSDGQVALDAAGKATVTARDPARDLKEPQDYLFEATVEDQSGQAVTVGRAVTAHQADLYLGLHPSEYVQAVDMPFGVQIVGFGREGTRRAAQVELTLTRRWYDCGVHDQESWACHRNQDEKPILRRAVTVAAAGSAAVERVTLKQPGEYIVSVTAPDGRGHTAIATQTIYVVGPGEAFWSGDEGDRMTLIASKRQYHPGDVARLVPQAQMPDALALTTLERDGILWHRVERLAGSGQAVEIPIEGRLAPNAYASVTLVRGRSGDGDAGRPRFKMGLANLEVDPVQQRLTVTVQTDRPGYRPGEQITARIKVTGADGVPVRSELAVAVADEGVLQIKGYKTPDPLPAFYAPWGLGVESSTTWNRIMRPRDPSADGENEEGGDGGGDEAGRIRSRFLATVFWAPAVVTGADGTARVRFTAPDNLTAFRVMVVGADSGARFGAGERRFTVSKPLQAVPALPRFLSVGDDADAAVLIANNTRAPLDATVRLSAVGVSLRGAATQTVKVAAGASKRLAFPISAADDGSATLTFHASGGGQSDAVAVTLPVQRPSVPDTVLVGEGAAHGRISAQVPALGTVVPGHGGLELALDAIGLSRLDEGLRYLVGYPYGCLEQTTSKVVPMVALTELGKTAELPGVAVDKARGFVQAGVAKILRHQHDDGGFGLWMGTPPEVHYTAYGLWGLMLARAAGYDVDERAMARGVTYLRRFVDSKPVTGSLPHIVGDAGERAFAHYVLAALGAPVPGSLVQLYQQRATLPVFGRAFLARALLKGGRTDLAATMADELAALVPGGGGPAMIKEDQRELGWYWSSDARSTALALSALLEIAPHHPAVRRLEQGLVAARVGGRWNNTQENVYGLSALAALARTRATGADVPITITVGAGAPVRRVLRGGTVERLRVPLDELGNGAIVIDSGDADVFYAARVRVDRPLAGTPAENGITVDRVYLDPVSDWPLSEIHLGQTVRVRLTVHSTRRLPHVAVVDRLPGGFEPVITRFLGTYAGDRGTSRPGGFWWDQSITAWQSTELRDDRVHVFADSLAAGKSNYEYLARATTVGSFQAPPATAEAMYQPEVNGRSAAEPVVVTP